MNIASDMYKPSLSLLTDLYQLTMAYGYWKNNRADDEAAFHLFFRKHPFGSGYTVNAGLSYAIDYLSSFSFTEEDNEYLGTLTGNDGKPLFVPILRKGKPVAEDELLSVVRERVQEQLEGLHKGIKRFDNPHAYPCGLDSELHNFKTEMMHSLRQKA